jgi:hypothetical protein
MSQDTPSVPLEGFLSEAGTSLTQAQAGLLGRAGDDTALTVAISEAELDVRATVERGADGRLRVRPVSIDDARHGVTAAALSSVRVKYVAIGDTGAEGPVPQRSAGEVEKEVAARDDLAKLREILGPLRVSAQFLPAQRRWLVSARDPSGRMVREVLVADSTGG